MFALVKGAKLIVAERKQRMGRRNSHSVADSTCCASFASVARVAAVVAFASSAAIRVIHPIGVPLKSRI